jgi:hypothetical protein
VEPPLEEPLVAPLAEEPTPGTSDGLSDATRRHNLDISLLARHIGRQETKKSIFYFKANHCIQQCCGSESISFLTRDPGWLKNQDPDLGSGSGMNIRVYHIYTFCQI